MTVTRETLYAEVWAEPMTIVAERYQVSSNYLARICERLSVPRPPRGYWQQRAVGRAAPIDELPEPDPGDELEWVRGAEPYFRSPPPPVFTPIVNRGTRRSERPKTHPILVGVREDFEDTKVSRYDDDGYLKPKKGSLPDIFVSKETLRSALSIANQLFLALEDQGHWVRMAPQNVRYHSRGLEHRDGSPRRGPYESGSRPWQPSQRTLVFVGGIAIGVSLFEIAENVEVLREDGKYVRASATRIESVRKLEHWRVDKTYMPSGRLGIYAYSAYGGADWTKYWRETKRGDLPGMFGEIAAELERAGPEIVRLFEQDQRRVEELHRKWETERLERERKEEERLREEAEAERRKEIRETIEEWRMARDIRAYVAEVKAIVKESKMKIVEGGSVDEELRWALAHADEIDPMTSWREDLASAKAEQLADPCPDCGEQHGPTIEAADSGASHDDASEPGAEGD